MRDKKKKKKQKYNYREDLTIDPDQLDVELLRQPNLYMKYAELSARAERKVKRCHETLKVLRSQILLKVRRNPKKYLGLEKATDAMAEAAYRKDEGFMKAKQEWMDASYDADLMKSAIFAFNNRRTSLMELVSLHNAQYFAGPVEPRNLSKQWQKSQARKEAASGVKKRLEELSDD